MRIADDLMVHVKPIDQFHPHPDNPKVGDVEAIAASLDRYGQVRPILARSDGEIVAGAHTWRAAVTLGADQIAATEFTGTEVEARAYRLADNALADRGHYDNALLLKNLETLHEELGDDLEAATGYTAAAMQTLIQGAGGGDRGGLLALADVTVGDSEREVVKGEVYRLGGVLTGHVLIVADLFADHRLWAPWLARAEVDEASEAESARVLFVPYPTPHLPFSDAAINTRLVMVAPDTYLCAKVLDAWAAMEGEDSISKVTR